MRVVFYEKPGCIGNSRQKAILIVAGHQIEAKSLLTHPWTGAELLSFFGELPVADWFNRSAPRVKSGEISPDELDAKFALALMLLDPLLIRRPLLEINGQRCAGFDLAFIEANAGPLPRDDRLDSMRRRDLETCPRDKTISRCKVINADSDAECSGDNFVVPAPSS